MGEEINCAPSNMFSVCSENFFEDHYEWFCHLDLRASNYLASIGKATSYNHSLRLALKVMEWSMHGVVWLSIIGYCLYTTKNVQAIPVFTNIFLALIFDLIVIGSVKLAFRRARPIHNINDMIAEAPYVDQFSFPSGHSSRGALMTKILLLLVPMDRITTCCVLIYPLALGVSRVMLGRHYLTDVFVGLLIGALEGDLVRTFWLSPEICVELVKTFRTFP